MDTNYIIKTKNLTKQYGSQKSVADLNIHVKRGRIYGLLGRNGAGKTTTMKMLLGLTKPTSGEVKIWGKSLQGNEKKLLPRIGSLIESPWFLSQSDRYGESAYLCYPAWSTKQPCHQRRSGFSRTSLQG